MDSLLLPNNAIIILRRAFWQPDARRFYEMMTGSFWWTDELIQEVAQLCSGRNNWSFRYLMAYRASLIRGKPNEGFCPVWDQIIRECPNWPGLRPERSSVSLATELHHEGRKQCVAFLRWERQLAKNKGAAKPGTASEGGV